MEKARCLTLNDINLVRSAMFWDRYNKEKKIVDLCMLPPCKGNLRLHFQRANYVAYVMRHAHLLRPNLQNFSLHGWDETSGEAKWVTALTPHDIVEVLVEAEEDASDEEIDIVSAFDDSGDEMEDDADFKIQDSRFKIYLPS